MIDDGLVVGDAIRLDVAAAELRGLLETCGVTPPDHRLEAYVFFANFASKMTFYGPSAEEAAAAREDWIARSFLSTLTEEFLKRALRLGELVVWTADQSGDRARDHIVLFAPSACAWHYTFSTGRYVAVQGQPAQPPTYVDARLWIKNKDWVAFRSSILNQRGGSNSRQLIDVMGGRGDSTWVDSSTEKAPPVRRGRPPGPGYSLADVQIFAAMLELQRSSGNTLSKQAAVEKLADRAQGNSRNAKVERLRKGLPIWLAKNGIEWL